MLILCDVGLQYSPGGDSEVELHELRLLLSESPRGVDTAECVSHIGASADPAGTAPVLANISLSALSIPRLWLLQYPRRLPTPRGMERVGEQMLAVDWWRWPADGSLVLGTTTDEGGGGGGEEGGVSDTSDGGSGLGPIGLSDADAYAIGTARLRCRF